MFRKPKRKAVTRDRDLPKQAAAIPGEGGGLHGGRATTEDKVDNGAAAVAFWETGRSGNASGEHDASEEDEEVNGGSELFRRKKRTKPQFASSDNTSSAGAVLHSYHAESSKAGTSAGLRPTHAELATRAAEHHSESVIGASSSKEAGAAVAGAAVAGKGADGIFRNPVRNKFAAGPIRAQTNVRVTARFDYQPDICKDYKDTGFCGFGDTCIYLHDRGDTMSGWQLEQAWELQQQQKKKQLQDEQVMAFVSLHGGGRGGGGDGDDSGAAATAGAANSGSNDDLPFACYVCRQAFNDPVVTSCGHYFCQSCIINHVRTASDKCPVCQRDTHSVFNRPNKLIAKMKRVVVASAGQGRRSAADAGLRESWQAYFDAMSAPNAATSNDWDG